MSRTSRPVSLRHPLATSLARALPLLVLALAATPALAAERVLDKTFTVKPGGVITVNADAAGVTVMGNDSSQVIVHMVAKGSQKDLDDMKFAVTQTEDGVNIEMKRPNQTGWFNWGHWNTESRIEVTAPRSFRVEAKTSGGSVRIEAVSGPSRLRTSGGSITARNVKGDVAGNTSGGGIRLESIEGMVDAHTSGGGVTATSVKGDIDASTSGGSVTLTGIDGKIRASTSGGGVNCELVGENRGISASTSGGGIRLTLPRNTAGLVDAATSGGSISSDFPVTTTRFSDHRLNGSINGGGETIYVRTSGGGITLNAK
jgi:putative adhesin